MAKLLLVEDDNNLREIYEARLSAEGYDISTAQNGEEALSIAKQLRPDLIISDVMMPRISGFEMLDILRNTDELKSTKIIMLTALGQAEDRSRADNLGADRYLVKSQVTLEDIVQAAHELLEDTGEEVAEPVATAAPIATAPVPEPVAESEPLTAPEPVAPPEIVPAPVEPVNIVAPPVQVTPEPIAEVPAALPQVVPVAEPPVAPEPAQPAVQAILGAPVPEPVTPPTAPVLDTTALVASDDVSTTATPTLELETDDLVLPQAVPVDPVAAPSLDPVSVTPQVIPTAITPEPAPVQPVTPEETANDAVLEAAINNLTTEPVAEVPSVPAAPAPVVASPTDAPINPSEPTGRKIISPITDPSEGPNINTLLAQEEAEEANQAAAPTPSSTITPNTPAASAPAPGLAPAPAPMNGVDPNSIAL